MFFLWLVAIAAGGFTMAPDQRAIGEVVIECIFVQHDNAEITTFVVGVTIGTTADFRVIEQPVKACLLTDVSTDVLVTIKTERALLAARKWLMTGGALGFEFSVSLCHRSWHDQ